MNPELVASRYRLGRSLGAGGMGEVWEAEDVVLQRPVAVKTVALPPDLDTDDRQSLHTRVLREARSAARIDHPSSVRVFDVVDDGDRLHVVMELVRAPTLADVVAQQGPLSPERAATVGLGVLGALEAAHRAGIVHRDVKPANVMMLDDDRVKLADFGIAAAKDDTSITAAGLVLGTPSYMAPEQAAGQPTAAPADMWGLGALLYFAVEGVAPFERGEALPTLNAVLHDEPRPMVRADGLAPTVYELLSKAPDARPSAASSRAALEGVAQGRRPEPTAPPTAAAGSTAVLPAPGGAAADTPSRARPRPTPPPRRPPPSPSGAPWLIGLGVVAVVALLAALALVNAGGDDDPTAAPQTTGATDPPPGGSDTAPGPSTTPPAGDGPAREEATPTTDAPEVDRPGGVPDNWVLHTDDATGHTVWHPPSWMPQPGPGQSTDFRDSATGDYLRVDYVQEPGDDPVQAWQDASARFADTYDDYEEIRIEDTDYRGFDAAIWEYTYEGQHATNLGFVTDDYGFALNFQTGQERWDDRQDVRDAFEAGFSPPA